MVHLLNSIIIDVVGYQCPSKDVVYMLYYMVVRIRSVINVFLSFSTVLTKSLDFTIRVLLFIFTARGLNLGLDRMRFQIRKLLMSAREFLIIYRNFCCCFLSTTTGLCLVCFQLKGEK